MEELGRQYKQAGLIPDLILTSSIHRAVESGRILAKEIGVNESCISIVTDLDEIDMGNWAGRLRSEVCVGDELREMRRLGKNFKGHGGESHAEVTRRAARFLRECVNRASRSDGIVPPATHFVAISHFTTIRCILGAVVGVGCHESPSAVAYNGRVMRLCYRRDSGRWELHGFNSTNLGLEWP